MAIDNNKYYIREYFVSRQFQVFGSRQLGLPGLTCRLRLRLLQKFLTQQYVHLKPDIIYCYYYYL